MDATPDLSRSLAFLDERFPGGAALTELGRAVGRSPWHLQRRFREATGLTPREYVAARRLARFRVLARRGEPVLEAGFAAGFGSVRGLYEAARDGLAMTPGRYARGGEGLAIAYDVVPGPLGHVLVGATERGLCAVLLGDDEEALPADLAAAFPRAALERSPRRLRGACAAVVRHLADTRSPLALPLDLCGTPFQLRVWRALRRIPPGETRTYSEIAAELGEPRAARAVARACARNAVAVLVPCHRVVPKEGGVGGYRWGSRRKRALLARERAARASHVQRLETE